MSSGVPITVVRVQGDRIRLGIEAPQEVPIMRRGIDCLGG
jgi:carbon storage regulator CsrA